MEEIVLEEIAARPGAAVPAAVRAVRALFGFTVLRTALFLLWLAPARWWESVRLDALRQVLDGEPVWTALEAAQLALLAYFAASRRGSRGSALATGAALAAALQLGLGFVVTSTGAAVSVGFAALHLALGLLLWAALASLSARPLWMTAAYVGLTVAYPAFQFLPLYHLSHHSPVTLYFSLAWVLSVGASALLLIAMAQIGWSAPGAASQRAAPATPDGQRDLLVGGAWLLGGLLVTTVSYASAAGGGHYLLTTGPIAYGLIRVIRGLGRAGSPSDSRG